MYALVITIVFENGEGTVYSGNFGHCERVVAVVLVVAVSNFIFLRLFRLLHVTAFVFTYTMHHAYSKVQCCTRLYHKREDKFVSLQPGASHDNVIIQIVTIEFLFGMYSMQKATMSTSYFTLKAKVPFYTQIIIIPILQKKYLLIVNAEAFFNT